MWQAFASVNILQDALAQLTKDILRRLTEQRERKSKIFVLWLIKN